MGYATAASVCLLLSFGLTMATNVCCICHVNKIKFLTTVVAVLFGYGLDVAIVLNQRLDLHV